MAVKKFPALSYQAFDIDQFMIVIKTDFKRAGYSAVGNKALQKRRWEADATSVTSGADNLIDLTLIVPQILIDRYIKIKN